LPPNLLKINCHNNQLNKLPGLPTKLTCLNCQNNQLLEIPNSLGQCSNLQTLYCSHNQLTKLPDSFGRCTSAKLQILSCENNKFAPPLTQDTYNFKKSIIFLY
jgi:Leucine-rich repeat (LRR) protein